MNVVVESGGAGMYETLKRLCRKVAWTTSIKRFLRCGCSSMNELNQFLFATSFLLSPLPVCTPFNIQYFRKHAPLITKDLLTP